MCVLNANSVRVMCKFVRFSKFIETKFEVIGLRKPFLFFFSRCVKQPFKLYFLLLPIVRVLP